MSKADLLALAARCEAAQGSCRIVDNDIAAALGWPDAQFTGVAASYTSSLDAAASLVPEGWTVERVMQSRGSHQWLCSLRAKAVRADSIAKTEPLARTAAALRARAAGMEDEG